MFQFDALGQTLLGPDGSLPVFEGDEIPRKLAMLYEGQCTELGPIQTAAKYGYTKQRYYQLLHQYMEEGTLGLLSKKRGPKTNYRRTDEAVRQVIRHKFLDHEASSEVIAQKLNQCGFKISDRTVRRILGSYGLQKKTPQVQSSPNKPKDRDSEN